MVLEPKKTKGKPRKNDRETRGKPGRGKPDKNDRETKRNPGKPGNREGENQGKTAAKSQVTEGNS